MIDCVLGTHWVEIARRLNASMMASTTCVADSCSSSNSPSTNVHVDGEGVDSSSEGIGRIINVSTVNYRQCERRWNRINGNKRGRFTIEEVRKGLFNNTI